MKKLILIAIAFIIFSNVAIAANEKTYFSECNDFYSITICQQDGWYIKEFLDENGKEHYIARIKGNWQVYLNGELLGEDNLNVQANILTKDEDDVNRILRASVFVIDFNDNTLCFYDGIIKYVHGELKFIKDVGIKCGEF